MADDLIQRLATVWATKRREYELCIHGWNSPAEVYLTTSEECLFRGSMDEAQGWIDLQCARAALQSIRDPTLVMVKAGVDKALSTHVSSDNTWPDYITDLFRTMVDAGMGESSHE